MTILGILQIILGPASPPPPTPGGFFQKNLIGCVWHTETLTLFQTKICDFPCPISDLIKI